MLSSAGHLRRSSAYGLPCEVRSHATPPPNCKLQCEESVPWKRDVALELSVDVERTPATILLSGTLNAATAVNLVGLVAEFINEGCRSFELRTSALCVADESGLEALWNIDRLVRRSGGNVAWDGSTANHPLSAQEDWFARRADARSGSGVPVYEDTHVRLLPTATSGN